MKVIGQQAQVAIVGGGYRFWMKARYATNVSPVLCYAETAGEASRIRQNYTLNDPEAGWYAVPA